MPVRQSKEFSDVPSNTHLLTSKYLIGFNSKKSNVVSMSPGQNDDFSIASDYPASEIPSSISKKKPVPLPRSQIIPPIQSESSKISIPPLSRTSVSNSPVFTSHKEGGRSSAKPLIPAMFGGDLESENLRNRSKQMVNHVAWSSSNKYGMALCFLLYT